MTRSVARPGDRGTWRRALLRLNDSGATCPQCQAALLYDCEQSAQRCWDCQAVLPVPPRLTLPGTTLVLAEGAVVTRHHLCRDRDYRAIAEAAVESHPDQAAGLVLRNLSQTSWLVVPDGEEPKVVAPGQRLAVRRMDIDFRVTRDRIMLQDAAPDLLCAPGRGAGPG